MSDKKYLGKTVEMKSGHGFDVARLDAYLHGTIKGYEGPLTVRQYEAGQSNLTYHLVTPKRNYVLRRKPPGKLLKSAHAVDREFRILTALGPTGFPVPDVLVLCEDESVLGTMFYVMSHIPGRVFYDCSMPDLSPEQRAAVFDSVNETLARLHKIDYKALGLENFGRPGNYFARQIARWLSQYEASKAEDIAEMDKLAAWLPGAVPKDDGLASITHGDFSFHNVLIHPTETHVVGVLDWELSTIGHPLGDVVYHLMEWYRPEGSDRRGTLRGRDLAALGVPSFEQYLARYGERTGFNVTDNIAFYRAYNLFRHAALCQGIAERVRAGTGAAADGWEYQARVRPLAVAAWEDAQRAGAA